MKRRAMDLSRDYAQLLAMQRLSWEINFPGRAFSEAGFHASLCFGSDADEISLYELDGEVVGWLWLDLGVRGVGHIRHIQVERAHWGQGLGRAIMDDALALCVQRGCQAVTLNVTKSNARAMALYAHLGFAVTDEGGERQRMKIGLVSQEKN